MRALVSVAEVVDAARWRLRRWSARRVAMAVNLAAELTGLPIEDDRPQVARILRRVSDGRDSWVALCAVLVLRANETGDVSLLFRAGIEIMPAYQQGRRAACRRPGDALDQLIEAYLADEPDAGPAAIWEAFTADADGDSWQVLDGFDAATGVLSFQARPTDEETSEIEFDAFRRRVQRIRARQQPAPVAVATDTGQHFQPGPLKRAA